MSREKLSIIEYFLLVTGIFLYLFIYLFYQCNLSVIVWNCNRLWIFNKNLMEPVIKIHNIENNC